MNGALRNAAGVEEYTSILERMLVLFERYGRTSPKDILQETISRLRAGEHPSILLDLYRTIGAKDSVFEQSFSATAIPPALPQAVKDTTELNWLIADLAEKMCNNEIGSRWVRDEGITRAIWSGDQAKAGRIQKVSFKNPKPTFLKKMRNLFRIRTLW